jgi:hypothetical protein
MKRLSRLAVRPFVVGRGLAGCGGRAIAGTKTSAPASTSASVF